MAGEEQPRISVIVPAYNVEAYVEAAMDSLLGQTAAFHEIIVINDGSTDATREKLAKYEAFPLVTVIDQANAGQGAARNAGIRRASGDYLYFFDADDVLDGRFVESVSALLAAGEDLDLVFFSGASFYDCPPVPGYSPPDYRRRVAGSFASGLEAAEALFRARSLFASPCLYVSRRRLWAAGDLAFAPIVHEDEEMILRLCLAARTTRVVEESWFRRRVRPGSTMTSPLDSRRAEGMLHALISTARLCRGRRWQMQRHRDFLWMRLAGLYGTYLEMCEAIPYSPRIWVCLASYLAVPWRPPLRLLARATQLKIAGWLRKEPCRSS